MTSKGPPPQHSQLDEAQAAHSVLYWQVSDRQNCHSPSWEPVPQR